MVEDTFASIQFVEEVQRSNSIEREVQFDDFKATFVNHLKLVEEENKQLPNQVAQMVMTIEKLPRRSLSVSRVQEDEEAPTTKASESPQLTSSPPSKHELEHNFKHQEVNIRMRYLERLTKEKVWLNPLQQPKHN